MTGATADVVCQVSRRRRGRTQRRALHRRRDVARIRRSTPGGDKGAKRLVANEIVHDSSGPGFAYVQSLRSCPSIRRDNDDARRRQIPELPSDVATTYLARCARNKSSWICGEKGRECRPCHVLVAKPRGANARWVAPRQNVRPPGGAPPAWLARCTRRSPGPSARPAESCRDRATTRDRTVVLATTCRG